MAVESSPKERPKTCRARSGLTLVRRFGHCSTATSENHRKPPASTEPHPLIVVFIPATRPVAAANQVALSSESTLVAACARKPCLFDSHSIDFSAVIERVKQIATESVETKRDFFGANAERVVRAAEIIIDSIKAGGKVLIFGNGGSAADAQHIAAELVNRLSYDRPPIAAIALTTDTSILTSVGNDATFDELFERQLRALGRAGDVAVAISTSGNSPNVLRAVEAAREFRIATIGLTGNSGGKLAAAVDLALVVGTQSTQRIQETHITIGHILCELIEENLFPQ